jgi:hypothetical protein
MEREHKKFHSVTKANMERKKNVKKIYRRKIFSNLA